MNTFVGKLSKIELTKNNTFTAPTIVFFFSLLYVSLLPSSDMWNNPVLPLNLYLASSELFLMVHRSVGRSCWKMSKARIFILTIVLTPFYPKKKASPSTFTFNTFLFIKMSVNPGRARRQSLRAVRWVALISYSVYLWHQSCLVLFRLRSAEIPLITPVVAVISLFLP